MPAPSASVIFSGIDGRLTPPFQSPRHSSFNQFLNDLSNQLASQWSSWQSGLTGGKTTSPVWALELGLELAEEERSLRDPPLKLQSPHTLLRPLNNMLVCLRMFSKRNLISGRQVLSLVQFHISEPRQQRRSLDPLTPQVRHLPHQLELWDQARTLRVSNRKLNLA